MPRVIQSPSARWPGTITLYDPLTYPQYAAWWDSVKDATEGNDGLKVGALMSKPHLVNAVLPGLLACVQEWKLGGDFPANVTAETFPATPLESSMSLLVVVYAAITEICTAADTIPNA